MATKVYGFAPGAPTTKDLAPQPVQPSAMLELIRQPEVQIVMFLAAVVAFLAAIFLVQKISQQAA
jgi:hypothetical protein